MRYWHKIFSIFSALIIALTPMMAQAVSLIRDAEIEDTLRAYGNPIFKVAGLNPQAIHIFLVDDPTINAYVAGGANMFIHSGLILKTETPLMLIGVMAHETGHMEGGHLAQGTEKLKNAQMGAILAAVLGAAIAVGGNAGGGMAAMSAGEQVALRNYLHFSRANESAADQSGMNSLDALGLSSVGMLQILEILRQNANRSYGTPDPYVQTHPLDIDRITHVRNHVMQSTISETYVPPGFNERHARMLAKLYGFMKTPEETLQRYPESDQSVAAHYARAIAYYKIPDLPKAMAELDTLLKGAPNDPFFHELKGQILFENGHIQDAAVSYAKAASILPNSPLILTDYGKVLIATENKDNLAKAITILEHARVLDDSNIDTWHYLAIAYGKTGNKGLFYLSSAEEASLGDDPKLVKQNAELAIRNLEHDSPARLRANDLKMLAEKDIQDRRSEGILPMVQVQ